MNWQRLILKDGIGWGLALWLFGYVLGFGFFAIAPAELIGWYILPIGLTATAVALWKWIRPRSLGDGLVIGGIWLAIAVVFDYLGIVKMLAPADGYYKLDVYIYYATTLLLPVIAGLLGVGRKVSGH